MTEVRGHLVVSVNGHMGNDKVELDGVDVTHAIRGIDISNRPGELTNVLLNILSMGGVEYPEALMNVTVVDTDDAIKLRNMLADALIALDTLTELHGTTELEPGYGRQRWEWGLHQEGPNGELLKNYIGRIRDARQLLLLQDPLFAACKALIDAPHADHFAVRMGDEELKALETIKSIVDVIVTVNTEKA